MKNIYIKTTWVDSKTPVNATNLNKIENALYDLYQNALSPSEIVEGNGIKVEVTQEKKLQISTSQDVMFSSSCCGVEIVTVEPLEADPHIIYFVLNPETGKLKRILFNDVILYEVE